MNTHNMAARQGLGYSGQELLTGKEAQKVLGEILESERRSRSLTYPAHTGARGFFYEKPKFVAFDNSSNDCWVEEFKTAIGARKWCRGQLSTDEVNELEAGIMRDRQRSREFRKACRDIARQLNGRASGGDFDGVAYFVDKPFIVSFTEDELSDWTNRFSEEEKVLGAYFSDNRIVPADFVILQRGNRIDAEQMPLNGLSLYSQLASVMKTLADDPKRATSHSMRVMDNDSSTNFTLAEDNTPHFENFLHALEKAAIPEEVLTGELMILPKNLHIWATMNTSDQSLFPIDSAFKRRWDWQYMPISDGRKGWKIDANGKQYDWWQFLQKMNNQIGSTTNSEDKKLGYYFCKAKGDTIDAETFVGKVIFYVWNDVFKDFAEEAGDLFKDTDGSLLSFNKFYSVGDDGRAKVIEEKVERILSNLGVSPIEVEFNIIDDEAEVENGSGNKHKSLRSVSFPDGIEFTADNMTHFEIYLESLKKIGLDEVCPIIESMKYRRKGCPMMSTEQLPGILNSDFTYHNEGKYFIVKGAIDDTLINILNDLNTKLNLGIDINYE